MKTKSFVIFAIVLLVLLNLLLLFFVAEVQRHHKTESQDEESVTGSKIEIRQLKDLLRQMGKQLTVVEAFSKATAEDLKQLKTGPEDNGGADSSRLQNLLDKFNVTETNKDLLKQKIKEVRGVIKNFQIEEAIQDMNGLKTIDMDFFDRQMTPEENDLEEEEDKKELIRKEDKWDFFQLTRYVQRELRKKQIPSSCDRTLFCAIPNSCGFCCAVHQLGFCSMIAFATNRTLIMKQNDPSWRYQMGCNIKEDGGFGWECFFRSISTCTEQMSGAVDWKQNLDHIPHLKAPFYSRTSKNFDSVVKKYGLFTTDGGKIGVPMYMPDIIKNALRKKHKDPQVWLVGQLQSFLLRTNIKVSRLIEEVRQNMGLVGPYYAIHVRRTDKISSKEAKLHHVSEYMDKIKEYMEKKGDQSPTINYATKNSALPSLFVATDDPTVMKELEPYESQFQIKQVVFGEVLASSLSNPENRWKRDGSHAIIVDLHFLSHAEYFVGTFSSQVTRLAYELQQAMRMEDCTECATSLDDPWYFP